MAPGEEGPERLEATKDSGCKEDMVVRRSETLASEGLEGIAMG
jgi:hypothetical protein